MALKKFNPITPGQRGLVIVDKSGLHKGDPVKKLTEGLHKTGGRNNSGHVTAWQRGGVISVNTGLLISSAVSLI